MIKKSLIFFAFVLSLKAQSIDLSKFYYRDYLDFGQGKGAFNGENSSLNEINSKIASNTNLNINSTVNSNSSTNSNLNSSTLTGKNGLALKIPTVPNFATSSNYGSLSSVGRGFVVSANHVTSPESIASLRKFGLSSYEIAKEELVYDNKITVDIQSISSPYGFDTKFMRFDKYIIEGSVDLLDLENTTKESKDKESENLTNFKASLQGLKDRDGNIYLYQAGSGDLSFFGTNRPQGRIYAKDNGQMRGGGFGTLETEAINYGDGVNCYEDCTRGISFNYKPNANFRNIITQGDSGSGIYAYDSKNSKWLLLGVSSQTFVQLGLDEGKISFVSKKELDEYKNKFEQKIDLKQGTNTMANNSLKSKDNLTTYTLEKSKDLVFSGGGDVEVGANIYLNTSKGYAGGLVFRANNSANNPTMYKFTNQAGQTHIFKGSGLDLEENVKLEWHLRNEKNDSLHKIGKGTLIIKTSYTPNANENLGYLKVGEGKVEFDTDKKAYEGIYITSGRGEIELKEGKAEAIGAVRNSALTTRAFKNSPLIDSTSLSSNTINSNAIKSLNETSLIRSSLSTANSSSEAINLKAMNLNTFSTNSLNLNSATSLNSNSYTLAQNSANSMGFYFGTGGGKLNLGGNSLRLNTVAANDSKAFITNLGSLASLEIEGFGYDKNNNKTNTKTNTIIHASLANGTNFNANSSTNSANLNLVYKDSKAHNASLIFDGHIDIKGTLSALNSNIVLQGHPTIHATINDASLVDKIKNAEGGTVKAMSSYMDLSRPSSLDQPDWDKRYFGIAGGIHLNNANLTVGKQAILNANITADQNSKISFGGVHFIDSKDGYNVGGSGFYYNQVVESGNLENENYEDSLYIGTIKADGASITSNFANFAPNLELSNKASLVAKNLSLNSANTLNFKSGSSARVDNFILQGFVDSNLGGKFTVDSSSNFSIEKSLSFDKSSFDLDSFSNSAFKLPQNYDLYALNGSKIKAKDFINPKQDAKIMLNNSSLDANNLSFTKKADLSLANSAALNLKENLKASNLELSLLNSSSLNANSIYSEEGTINLNNKATLTLTKALTSKNLNLNLLNQSSFKAQTVSVEGDLNIRGDEGSTLNLESLNLKNSVANIENIKAKINTVNLTQSTLSKLDTVLFERLNLNQSAVNLGSLNDKGLKSIDLKANSQLYLNELNLNESLIKITSDTNSHTVIKKLSYDLLRAQNIAQAPQSNFIISENLELKNIGQNLGTNSQEDQKKDLLSLEFSKDLELSSGTRLDLSFSDKLSKDKLIFNQYYTVFTAQNLKYSDLSINFKDFNGKNLEENEFFIRGRLNENAFFVEFLRQNPRSVTQLSSHIDPAYKALLEIFFANNPFATSINTALITSSYVSLQEDLKRLDNNFKDLATSSQTMLNMAPLLQRQELNSRMQELRLSPARYVLNENLKNPLQRSDIISTVAIFDKIEQANRVYSSVGAGLFTTNDGNLNVKNLSLGYDNRIFDNFLLGISMGTSELRGTKNLQQNPKIYNLSAYSNAFFEDSELQNELGFSIFNDKKQIEEAQFKAKGYGSFLKSLYKFELGFLPKNLKGIALVNVNYNAQDAINSASYIQKAYKDLSFDLGLGADLSFELEEGYYSTSFLAVNDLYHSEDEVKLSLKGANNFIAYKIQERGFSYQMHINAMHNLSKKLFFKADLSGFLKPSSYKGVRANLYLGYKY